MGKDNRGEQILELRNRLDEIYSSWLLRFEPVIEREILSVLEKLALEGESSYVRMEAVMAIGSIGRADSLPVLEKAAQDPDELVRKYARKAIEKIQNPNSRRTYDDVIEVLEYWTKKPVKK